MRRVSPEKVINRYKHFWVDVSRETPFFLLVFALQNPWFTCTMARI